jgi:hypothetical protein
MSSEGECGTLVVLDDIQGALKDTRLLRLALEVLWNSLPPDMETDGTQEALWGIVQKIGEAELRALSASGLNRQYVIIKPLDMTKVPDPGTLRKISEAIRVLADCGLILPTSD